MLKFPKKTDTMRNVQISYTTSPISEYLGSQIYASVGIPVHETKLGVFDNKLVVACKDITFENMEQIGKLNMFSDLKNLYNPKLFDSYSNSGDTKLNKTLQEINTNYFVEQLGVDIVLERFWTMFIIDTLIYNNDRNNGNWGLLINGDVKLAPVYDNGNSFNNKFSDREMYNRMEKIDVLQCKKITSVFRDDEDKLLIPYEFFETQNIKELNQAIEKVVPLIDIKKIFSIIDELPNEYADIKISSDISKEFMKKGIAARYDLILKPALEKILSYQSEKKPSVLDTLAKESAKIK
ncbi:MAG: CtkA family protein [Clostridia bacterium]